MIESMALVYAKGRLKQWYMLQCACGPWHGCIWSVMPNEYHIPTDHFSWAKKCAQLCMPELCGISWRPTSLNLATCCLASWSRECSCDTSHTPSKRRSIATAYLQNLGIPPWLISRETHWLHWYGWAVVVGRSKGIGLSILTIFCYRKSVCCGKFGHWLVVLGVVTHWGTFIHCALEHLEGLKLDWYRIRHLEVHPKTQESMM